MSSPARRPMSVDGYLSREIRRPRTDILLLTVAHSIAFRMMLRNVGTDALTQVGNRATLDRRLDRHVSRGSALALVMIDIDHFKQVNTDHGHRGGDEALTAVGRSLAATASRLSPPNRYGGRVGRLLGDALAIEDPFAYRAARYGGEEFAVVLPGCDVERAVEVAEEMRKAIQSASRIPLTASAGVAVYPRHASRVHVLVEAADAALSRSKNEGRNRTSVATDPVKHRRV